LLSEVTSIKTSLPLNGSKPLLVAVAATDSNGDSGLLSDMLEVITPPQVTATPPQVTTAPPQVFSLLSPDYIPQDVVIVTDPANGEYILKWRHPALSTDDIEVVVLHVYYQKWKIW